LDLSAKKSVDGSTVKCFHPPLRAEATRTYFWDHDSPPPAANVLKCYGTDKPPSSHLMRIVITSKPSDVFIKRARQSVPKEEMILSLFGPSHLHMKAMATPSPPQQ
uniref:MSP domain-containing protein n=1 Tax=Haemonchus placei TaxID=6290 RepID=A0A0N4X6V8_HAEPC